MNITITKATTLKDKPEASGLGFGKYYTDHMFIYDYTKGQGWHDARIIPYAPLALDPAAIVLHYAVEVFEGMKAYRTPDGEIQLFRPLENARRLNDSSARLCIPNLPEEEFLQAVKTLVDVERDWVPSADACSLYIRPFIIANEPHLGVREANNYQFIIILSPVGSYYPEGLNPVKIFVEEEYVRAVRGGTGFTKCGGNYAGSLIGQTKAHELGYSQVLWLDGVERKYIEEVGAMNIMFKINGTVVTPELNGSILPGITRKSVLELLRSWGVPTEERRVSEEELAEAAKNGTLEEVFGTGTAAVISPVGTLRIRGTAYEIGGGKIGELSQKLYDTLTGIQWGKLDDPFNWTVRV